MGSWVEAARAVLASGDEWVDGTAFREALEAALPDVQWRALVQTRTGWHAQAHGISVWRASRCPGGHWVVRAEGRFGVARLLSDAVALAGGRWASAESSRWPVGVVGFMERRGNAIK